MVSKSKAVHLDYGIPSQSISSPFIGNKSNMRSPGAKITNSPHIRRAESWIACLTAVFKITCVFEGGVKDIRNNVGDLKAVVNSAMSSSSTILPYDFLSHYNCTIETFRNQRVSCCSDGTACASMLYT